MVCIVCFLASCVCTLQHRVRSLASFLVGVGRTAASRIWCRFRGPRSAGPEQGSPAPCAPSDPDQTSPLVYDRSPPQSFLEACIPVRSESTPEEDSVPQDVSMEELRGDVDEPGELELSVYSVGSVEADPESSLEVSEPGHGFDISIGEVAVPIPEPAEPVSCPARVLEGFVRSPYPRRTRRPPVRFQPSPIRPVRRLRRR